MKKRTLHYGSLAQMELEQDIAERVFYKDSLIDRDNVEILNNNCNNSIPCVYLFSCQEDKTFTDNSRDDSPSHVLVTDRPMAVEQCLDEILRSFSSFDSLTFFLQEYTSYEDAYSVALHMMEGHPLCYNE